MSFDWLAYLTLAEYMNEKSSEFPDKEACYRAVISRAYYAVFCSARNCVRDFDKVTFHTNDHQALQDHLLSHSYKRRKMLGQKLRELHQHRIKADYHDDLGELAVNKSNKALVQARKIADILVELFKN